MMGATMLCSVAAGKKKELQRMMDREEMYQGIIQNVSFILSVFRGKQERRISAAQR
jgi:hypothetical protein